MIAAYIDEIIMFFAGAWMTAVGFGWLPAPGQSPAGGASWLERYGTLFKWGGPLLVAISIILAAAS